MVGARLCSGFKCEVECAKVASWSRCSALLLSGVCYKKFAVPACNILASFWFKTLVSSIDDCFNGNLMRWLILSKYLWALFLFFLSWQLKIRFLLSFRNWTHQRPDSKILLQHTYRKHAKIYKRKDYYLNPPEMNIIWVVSL